MAVSQTGARIRRDNKMRHSVFLVGVVVVILIVVVAAGSYKLQKQLGEKEAYIKELSAKIAAEDARTKEIEEFQKYTETRGYVEKIAKEKLGLVYDGEIIFRHE